MKKTTFGIAIVMVAFASSPLHGEDGPRGVAGVDVFVKQNPSKRATTNASGAFAFDGLPAGSFTLTFKAKKAGDTRTQTSDKVTVATSYSINIEGAKRVVKSGLTGDDLLGGFELRVDGAGSKIRGKVAADALQKMVWIAKEPGSNIPGRWVVADSPEAKAAFKGNAQLINRDDMRQAMDRGNPNMQTGGGETSTGR